jgi:diacylglycerol kinase (ATP)
MTTKRVRIIVNPSARSGHARRAIRLARTAAARHPLLRCEWVESRSASHLRELVRAAQDEQLDAVAVAGGDGTVAIAVDALNGPNRVPLAVLPIGSGNDFAHDLGMPRDVDRWFDAFAHGVLEPVDVARVMPDGPRFCCVASVGLDEFALRMIHGSWLPRSKALNVLSALRALWAYRPRAVRIDWDGGRFEGEVMFAAVTNTRSYGGGFLVSPVARLDDGLLDLCIVRRTGRRRLLWNFPRILTGTHGALPEVVQAMSSWFRIEGLDGELPVTLDGELPNLMTPVELRSEPGAVTMLKPVSVRQRRETRRLETCQA